LAEQTARLAKRDPNKNALAPAVQSPVPIIPQPKPSPENGQSIPPKITVAKSIPAQSIPLPVAAPVPPPAAVVPESTPATAQPSGTVSNRRSDDERKPIFTLPKGSFLSHDEQARLLDLFRTTVATSKNETERRAARIQLEKVISMPDAARSLFAVYLLKMVEYLDKHPEEKPKTLPAPPTESNPEYDTFHFNFFVNRLFQNIAEQERIFKAQRQVKDYAEQGGIWDGLPAI